MASFRFFEYRVWKVPVSKVSPSQASFLLSSSLQVSQDNLTLDTDGSLVSYILPTPLRVNKTYSLLSSSLNLLLLHLVPLVLLTSLNTLTFVNIKRSSNKLQVTNRRRRDLDIASALSIIVLVFIICHGAKFIINLVEFINTLAGES